MGRTSSPPAHNELPLTRSRELALATVGIIPIPDASGSAFDHGAFDVRTRRLFIAHTARDCVEVIDHDAQRHIATLSGFGGAAGVVADDGQILVTNRGADSASIVDAGTLKTVAMFKTGSRPNGAALLAQKQLALVACIGDEVRGSKLQSFGLEGGQHRSIDLPGRPRWCATDAAAERLFLAIREPSMVLVAVLAELDVIAQWRLPSHGAHGLDVDHERGRIYVACDDGALIELDSSSGKIYQSWSIAGPPDVTFFNPATGRIHAAIGDPGVVESVEPHSGRTGRIATARGAHTTVLVPPDRLYVISPDHGGLLVLADN